MREHCKLQSRSLGKLGGLAQDSGSAATQCTQRTVLFLPRACSPCPSDPAALRDGVPDWGLEANFCSGWLAGPTEAGVREGDGGGGESGFPEGSCLGFPRPPPDSGRSGLWLHQEAPSPRSRAAPRGCRNQTFIRGSWNEEPPRRQAAGQARSRKADPESPGRVTPAMLLASLGLSPQPYQPQ